MYVYAYLKKRPLVSQNPCKKTLHENKKGTSKVRGGKKMHTRSLARSLRFRNKRILWMKRDVQGDGMKEKEDEETQIEKARIPRLQNTLSSRHSLNRRP